MCNKTGKSRSAALASQGFFSRLFGGLTGKNQRLQAEIDSNFAAAQYASQICLQKLAEQNLMTFELVAAVNNKLNAFAVNVITEFNNVNREINNVYGAMNQGFKNVGEKFKSVDREIDNVYDNMNQGFQKVGEKFDSVDQNINNLNNNMNSGFQKVDEKFNSVDRKINNVSDNMISGFQVIGEEFNNVYRVLNNFFRQTQSDIVQLEQRIDRLEQNVKLLTWTTSIEFKIFKPTGVEYESLSTIGKIVCLTKNFYDITQGKWTTSDLLLFKTALSEVNISPKNKITYLDFLQGLIEEPIFLRELLSEINLDEVDAVYTTLLEIVKKYQLLETAEKYQVDSISDMMTAQGVNVPQKEITTNMVAKYISDESGVSLKAEMSIYEFCLELIYNIEQMKFTQNQKLLAEQEISDKFLELESQLKSKTQIIDNLEAQLNSKNSEIIKLRSQSESISREINSLQSKLNSKSQEISSLSTQLNSRNQDMDNLRSQSDSKSIKINDLQSNLNSQAQEISSLRSQLNSKSREISNLESQLRSKYQDIYDLRSKLNGFYGLIGASKKEMGTDLFQMGYAYEFGINGKSQNINEAIKLYKLALDIGDNPGAKSALNRLGRKGEL